MKRFPALIVFFLACLCLASDPVSATSRRAQTEVNDAVRLLEKSDVPGEEESGGSYLIGTHNLLQVKIFGEANVNPIYRVEEDGSIKHSLVGRVKVGGLSVVAAEKLMEELLDGDYIINPQVNILVLEYSRFSIIGEVKKPGNYEISGRTSLIRAISLAGGFTPIANQKDVHIIRTTSDGMEQKIAVDTTRIMRGDLSAEVDLQAEDVVIVPKSFF